MRRWAILGMVAALLGCSATAATAATPSLKKLAKQVSDLRDTVDQQQTQLDRLQRNLAFVDLQHRTFVACLQRSLLDDSNGYVVDSTLTLPIVPNGYAFATTITLPDQTGTQNVPLANPFSQVWIVGVKNTQACLNAVLYHSPYASATPAVLSSKVAALRARGD